MYCSTAAVTVLNLSGRLAGRLPEPAIHRVASDIAGSEGPCHAAVGVGLVNNGRDELDIPVKAKYDGEYAKDLGLKMDVKCFLGFLLFLARMIVLLKAVQGR